MVAPYNPNQSYTTSGPSGASTTPTTLPSAAPSFPGTGTAAQPTTPATIPGLPPPPPTSMTWAQFEADNHLSSTDMPIYTDSAGNLNGFASWLINYKNLSQSDRQQLQQEMVNAGLLTAAQATGRLTATTNTAVLNLIGLSSQNQSEPLTYLGTSDQGKLGAVQQQLAAEVTSADTTIASQPAVTVNETSPTTLDSDLTTAFDQALGYAASPAQQAAFVAAFHAQEVGQQTANLEENRTQSEANLTRAQGEQTALKALGPNDVTTFVTAYAAAVHGTGVPGAGTQQGPVTGAQLAPTAPNPNAAGVLRGPTLGDTATSVANGPFDISGGLFQFDANRTHDVTTPVSPPTVQMPSPSIGAPNTVPLHGGVYALSPKLWQQALSELGPAAQKKYGSMPIGQVPVAIQQAAFTALSSALYDQHGNWADVAIQLAGGAPGITGKSNIQDFANGVASKVNDNITVLQAQATSQPVVTTKVTAPSATDEANLTAKNSDPIGYTAANYSSWAGTLSKMLYGPPSTAINQTSDAFTGPVSPPAGVAASAPQATAA